MLICLRLTVYENVCLPSVRAIRKT